MSVAVVMNRLRKGFYLDSVALMRISKEISSLPGVKLASMMIGTPANKQVLAEVGLLNDEGRTAEANDVIVSLRADTGKVGEAALAEAERLLAAPALEGGGGFGWRPKTLDAALDVLPAANLALISVPGEFAGEEARRALRKNLHVMLFSDHVSLEEERLLKAEARERGLLLMGPDCGTAILGGVPLAFANEVPRGGVGLIAASGTGLQEVACLIGRGGGGISHAIGVGGRDLNDEVGGIMMLSAIDALDADPDTRHVVLISKPPGRKVAGLVLERVSKSPNRFTVCFLGLEEVDLPKNARLARTLTAAAEDALGVPAAFLPAEADAAGASASGPGGGGRWIRGLFSGGTLCAEAQVVLLAGGEDVRSNAPVAGALSPSGGADGPGNILLDLGADEYTRGRPHPMIDPSLRNEILARTLSEPDVSAVLLDVVIGHGSNVDPAGDLADAVAGIVDRNAFLVASVCGTEEDPQKYSDQVEKLKGAGVAVASSNARAAELALSISRRRSG